jgi:uncharacterized repeat protein (TIGR01451 family)
MKYVLFAFTLATATAAIAQSSAVSLTSKVFVAREVTDAQGRKKNQLFPPDRVLPGEAIVVMLDYRNNGAKPATNFVINNPIPAAVTFTGAEQPWATVSVDRGKSFGALASLKATGPDGSMRPALPSDVTNVRWTFVQPIAPQSGGRVMFFGTVK